MEPISLSTDLVSLINKYVRFEDQKHESGKKFTMRMLNRKNKLSRKNKTNSITTKMKPDLLISLHDLTELELIVLKDRTLSNLQIFEKWHIERSNLFVKLCRPILCSKILGRLMEENMRYFFSECHKSIVIGEINQSSFKKHDLNYVRQNLSFQCILNLLRYCGCDVFVHKTSISDEENLLIGNKLLTKAKELLAIDAKGNVDHCESAVSASDSNEDDDDYESLTLQVKNLMLTEYKGFDVNVNSIPVLHSNEEWSSVFKKVVDQELYVRREFTSLPDIYLHIVSEKNTFHVQQTSLLWKALGEHLPSSLVHCLIGSTILDDSSAELDANKFHQCIYELVEKSASHKLEGFAEDKDWKVQVASITDSCIKFKLLSSSIWNVLRSNMETLHGDCVKPASFIMYNYSRISSILTRFEEEVKMGKYPPLPPITEIDISLLNRDEEWNLLVHYVAALPGLIEEIAACVTEGEKICLKVPLHKLFLFLLNLSHDLSSYYCSVHILVEPFPHLMQLMFSRLLLMKAIHLTMKCVFAILDINPVEQM